MGAPGGDDIGGGGRRFFGVTQSGARLGRNICSSAGIVTTTIFDTAPVFLYLQVPQV